MSFHNRDSSGTVQEYLTIKADGDVGIGDTSPSTALTSFGSASRGLSIKNGQPTIALVETDDSDNEFWIAKANGNAYLQNEGNGFMRFYTNGSQSMEISANGYVGIKATPGTDTTLTIANSDSSDNSYIIDGSHTATNANGYGARFSIVSTASGRDILTLRSGASGSETTKHAFRGDGSAYHTGNVGIGTTSPSSLLHIESDSADPTLRITNKTTAAINTGPDIEFWNNPFTGSTTNSYESGAIRVRKSNGSDNNHDHYMSFEVRKNSPEGINEAMRIASNGYVQVGKIASAGNTAGASLGTTGSEFVCLANPVLYVNRHNNDGTIISLRQADSEEGTISVSGSTVSYNGFSGNHESSGIPTNTAIGTVVSTIDELDVYPDTDYKTGEAHSKAGETRADHAKIKVSDSVGDKRVYGVLSSFNEDNKSIVASVGIGSVKVTGACAGGDLLESNGDGTAKVQDDDIIRSKTIGKVTIGDSNTGVKLVSCVLYCG